MYSDVILKSFSFASFILIYKILYSVGLQAQVVLEQGAIAGLKIFPDGSNVGIYSFLGIPYAEPPVGPLRFSRPKKHKGWNGTLQATNIKPLCPQLTNTFHDEITPFASRPNMDEDCLYLNIWAEENALKEGNLSVVVLITGEDMSFDWPRKHAFGIDLAAEGLIVVTIQYRMNIFGWLSLDNNVLPGNYGFNDIEMALEWIKSNIKYFGGNVEKMTLLGHGSSGASCSFGIVIKQLCGLNTFNISKLIMMSGGDIIGSLDNNLINKKTSQMIINKLGCQFFEKDTELVKCLRYKSSSDLLKAFESFYHNWNLTYKLGPNLEGILNQLQVNKSQSNEYPTMMIGITSNEGAYMQDFWLELARESCQNLYQYFNTSFLPKILHSQSFKEINDNPLNALHWYYLPNSNECRVPSLLDAMNIISSEAFYEVHFYKFLDFLTEKLNLDGKAYVYVYHANNSMDMRGKINIFKGASHGSDFLLALGSSIFHQISRRRLTAYEDEMSRKIKRNLLNFINNGNPNNNSKEISWLPYQKEWQFIFNLGEDVNIKTQNRISFKKLKSSNISTKETKNYDHPYQNYDRNYQEDMVNDGYSLDSDSDSGYAIHLKKVYAFWNIFLNALVYKLDNTNNENELTSFNKRKLFLEASARSTRYKDGFFAMISLVIILFICLVLCMYLLRRHQFHPSSNSLSITDYSL